MAEYAVVITGASGSVYGMKLTERLLAAGEEVALMATPAGRDVLAHELGVSLPEGRDDIGSDAVAKLLEYLEAPPKAVLRMVAHDDIFDRLASGSHPVAGMVVIPASMGFCGSIAAGLASDLPERVADVMLKERRPLVLVPRETPLNVIHLRNLTTLAEAGAVILPAMPAFYQKPRTLDDAVDFVVGKALYALGIEHDLFTRWGE